MSDEYKPIPGWTGYFASERGNILSCRRTNPVILKPERVWNGYHRVVLASGRRTYHHRSIHTLILLTFVGPRPPGQQGCHIDGNLEDNSLANLRWATVLENHRDKQIHGTVARGSRQGASKLTEADVRAIKARVASESDVTIAKDYGVTPAAIYLIKTGRNWRHIAA